MYVDFLKHIGYYLNSCYYYFVCCGKGKIIMKCSNCGFESDGKFCSNCGAELPQNDVKNPNVNNEFTDRPDLNAPNPADNAGWGEFDTSQPQSRQDSRQNENAYQPPVYAQPPKKSKTLPVLLGSIIGLILIVIVAVVLILVAVYDKGFLKSDKESETSSGSYDYLPEDFADSYKIYGDYGKLHETDEVFECPVGKVSLTDVKVTNEELSDEDYCVYAVTFEFENTTSQPLCLDVYSSVLEIESFEYCDDAEYLYTDADTKMHGNNGYVVKAGETIKFVEHYKALKDGEEVVLEFYLTEVKDFDFEIDIMYDVDFSDYIEDTQETNE